MSKKKSNPLWVACYQGHKRIANVLLNNGSVVNLCFKNGLSPLIISCKNGHENTVEIMLNNGFDVNICEDDEVSFF